MAVLTRLEDATDRAARLASESEAAPPTRTVISLVAPSPSRAIERAMICATSTMPACRAAASGLPAVIGRLPASPLASSRKVSFVELSPSTDT
ncbi:MAG: hypothetical protein AUI15_38715 [Actinobacteria bacterium 13_2_20CM_2_66_6]|nr:MAG: hypothetical protein AUI15_38715 [Actinobacteria bacterium 13_2_20CM_2_66_6]